MGNKFAEALKVGMEALRHLDEKIEAIKTLESKRRESLLLLVRGGKSRAAC